MQPWPIINVLLNLTLIVIIIGTMLAMAAWFLYLVYIAWRSYKRDVALRQHKAKGVAAR